MPRDAEPALRAPLVPLYLHPTPPSQPVIAAYYMGNYAPEVAVGLATAAWGWHIETAIHVLHLGRLIEQFADQRVLLTSGVDQHHGLLQFTWARVGSDGRKIRTGIDFGEVAADGRLLRMTGFFGPPPPIPLTFPADLVLH